MKSFLLSILWIVLLTACAKPAPATTTVTASVPPTQTALASPTETELPVPTQTELSTPSDTPTPLFTPKGLKVCVLPQQLNVRSGPGTTYTVLVGLKRGSCIIVIARNSSSTWFWEITSNTNGWVSGAYLSHKAGVNLNALPLLSELIQTPGALIQTPVPQETTQP
jgi:uncharacterized protein YgiM (DUF1202 family)